MALDARLSEKWEPRLYRWHLWSERTGPRISSAYSERVGSAALPDDVMRDADRHVLTGSLLSALRVRDKRLHAAILEYVRDEGTRGAQAARLSIHPDTYRARVNGAMVLLEVMHNARRRPRPTTHAMP